MGPNPRYANPDLLKPLMPSLQPLSPQALQSVRLIATDMDGTLTQQEKFTPMLLQTLLELSNAQIPVLIVTGRSAGWVNAVAHYLPIWGAIAENGGLFYDQKGESALLSPISAPDQHRQKLAQMFETLQAQFPQIRESNDNRFRITDWTFDVAGLSLEDLRQLNALCQAQGWGFTYSTVQCHIKPLVQEKSSGLQQILRRYFPALRPTQILTVGDSPNDQSLFDPIAFPVSAGVANIRRYADQMAHLPLYMTQTEAAAGFCELAQAILQARLA